MGNFLRDQIIENLTIDEVALSDLNDVFVKKLESINNTTRSDDASEENENFLYLTYIIRFDQNGYRLFDFTEVLKNFKIASKVERIVFSLETVKSIKNNRIVGSYAEITFDSNNPNNCYFVVSSEYEDQVTSFFPSVIGTLNKYKNNNAWFRNNWTKLLIQVFGVVFGFALSLWGATKISPHLTIVNAFVISFIFILILFSNLWSYSYKLLLTLVNNLFPQIKFKRADKGKLNWLLQTIIGGIIFVVTLYLIGEVFDFIGNIIGGFIKRV
jgi:hypothetical protein